MTEPARVIVARNIRRLRQTAGWSQEEARNRLAQHGILWTKQVWSIAETSADGGKVRVFTADEIMALAAVFGVTPDTLFGLPDTPAVGFAPAVDSSGTALWLTAGRDIVRSSEGRDGWRRLHVEAGGAA